MIVFQCAILTPEVQCLLRLSGSPVPLNNEYRLQGDTQSNITPTDICNRHAFNFTWVVKKLKTLEIPQFRPTFIQMQFTAL